MADRSMRFATSIATAATGEATVLQLASSIRRRLGDQDVDLALLFVSPDLALRFPELGRLLRAELQPRVLLGTTAQGVIGGRREHEQPPCMALFAGIMPNVRLRPFAVPAQLGPEPPLDQWRDAVPTSDPANAFALLFTDPFTIDFVRFVDMCNEDFPGMRIAGGVSSGSQEPGTGRLYLNDAVHDNGMVGVVLSGDIAIQTVVSQGCRPIGRHLIITKARGNVIEQVGGKPALEVLKSVLAEASKNDQVLAAQGLHVGRVIDEQRDSFGRGDFLIRNPIGVDPATGALAVADSFRTGQTVQFHVRDASTASEDLTEMLAPHRNTDARGALLFTCNGRGERFFGHPNHDSQAIEQVLGDIPTGGFFCAGEIGPVGGTNFVHGYTSSMVLFGPRKP